MPEYPTDYDSQESQLVLMRLLKFGLPRYRRSLYALFWARLFLLGVVWGLLIYLAAGSPVYALHISVGLVLLVFVEVAVIFIKVRKARMAVHDQDSLQSRRMSDG